MSTLNNALGVSASALTAERVRIEAAVSNLANAESTRGPDGQPYRRRDVVLAADPQTTFEQALGQASAVGVKVAAVVEDQTPPKMRYDPSHPDANAEGFVALPNIDTPEEMVNMLSASRAYQANLTAIGLIRDVVQKSLALGKWRVPRPVGSIAPSIATPVGRAEGGAASSAASTSSASFGDSLARLVNSVETSDQTANTAVQGMLDGTADVHDAMIAL